MDIIQLMIGPVVFMVGMLWAVFIDPKFRLVLIIIPASWIVALAGIVLAVPTGFLSVTMLIVMAVPTIFLLVKSVGAAKEGDKKRQAQTTQQVLQQMSPACPGCKSPTQYSKEEGDFYCWNCKKYVSDMKNGQPASA